MVSARHMMMDMFTGRHHGGLNHVAKNPFMLGFGGHHHHHHPVGFGGGYRPMMNPGAFAYKGGCCGGCNCCG